MTPELLTAIGAVIAGIAAPISVVLVAYIGSKVGRVEKTLVQVEKQGNSRHLEMTRVVLVALEKLFEADPSPKNNQLVEDARKVYEAAKSANENL